MRTNDILVIIKLAKVLHSGGIRQCLDSRPCLLLEVGHNAVCLTRAIILCWACKVTITEDLKACTAR